MGRLLNVVLNKILWGSVKAVIGLLLKLAGFVLSTAGRVVAIVIGLVLIVAGILLSLTVIGAIAGVPLSIIGGFILLKGILP